MTSEQLMKQWGQIVVKAWQDNVFKKRLLTEPATILKENGVEVPAGLQIRVVENTDKLVHLTLPPKPREGELSDDDLENVAGGVVSIEYLILGTYLALALVVGVAPARDTSDSKTAAPAPAIKIR
jgi:Nitrile hydratase, alpha chain